MRDWEAYFTATDRDRPPWPLFLDAVDRFPADGGTRRAVDLGTGHGVETLALLRAGWRVLAVDGQVSAVERLRARVEPAYAERLTLEQSDLGSVELPPCDLVWAGFSIFYLPSDRFQTLWRGIRSALAPGGRFAGQFLGDHDTWASDDDVTALSRAGVEEQLDGMTIEHLEELEEDGSAVSGPKHWHFFHVIACVAGEATTHSAPQAADSA